jgi:hypothetical protein
VKNTEKVKQVIICLESGTEAFRKTVEAMGKIKIMGYPTNSRRLQDYIQQGERESYHAENNQKFYQQKTGRYNSRKKINKRAIPL